MKIKTLLSSTLLLASACGPLSMVACSNNKEEKLSESHIISFNDIHGQIPGFGDDFYDQDYNWPGAIRLARDTQEIIQKYPGSFMISGGDNNSMGQYANCNQGDSLYTTMSAMDCRYSVVGNHAWDYNSDTDKKLENGYFDKLGRTKDTEKNYFLTANILNGDNEQDTKTLREYRWESNPSSVKFDFDYQLWRSKLVKWADPYKIVNMNDHYVGVIGLTTDDIYSDGKQSQLGLIAASDYIASINYTKKLMKEQKPDEFDKIDAFILATHVSAASTKDDPTKLDPTCDAVANIASKLDSNSNVDAILCGHSHKEVVGTYHNEALNKDIWVAEAGWKGMAFSDTKLEFDDTKQPGKRLKSVSIELKHPYIEYGGYDPKTQKALAREAAASELDKIRLTTENQVVKNTIFTYLVEKAKTEKILGKELGELENDLLYTYTGAKRGYQSDTMVDQAGAWAMRSQIIGFNQHFKEDIESDKLHPVSFSLLRPDSSGGTIQAGKFLLRDVYKIFQFENYVTYGSCTYSQLEQLCNFLIHGDTRNATQEQMENLAPYNDCFYYDDEHKEKIYQSEDEYNGILWNPIQWYGLAFEVTKEEQGSNPDNNWRNWAYKPHSLRVYDPTDVNQDVQDPTTWGNETYWKNKYIFYTSNSFSFPIATGDFRMLHMMSDWNAKNKPDDEFMKVKEWPELLQSQLVLDYCDWMKAEHSDQSLDLDASILSKLFIKQNQ